MKNDNNVAISGQQSINALEVECEYNIFSLLIHIRTTGHYVVVWKKEKKKESEADSFTGTN